MKIQNQIDQMQCENFILPNFLRMFYRIVVLKL